MKKIATFIFLSTLIFVACSKSKDDTSGGGGNTLDCSTVSAKAFSADVNPIIQTKCAISGCHNAGSINGPGPLTTYSEIFNARTNIRSAVGSGTMPKTGSITTAQKNSILCWIDSGAANN